jgi:hypothetical protein
MWDLDIKLGPRFGRVNPLQPRPTASEGKVHKMKVRNAQTPEDLWRSYLVPGDETVTAMRFSPPLPQETSTDFP